MRSVQTALLAVALFVAIKSYVSQSDTGTAGQADATSAEKTHPPTLSATTFHHPPIPPAVNVKSLPTKAAISSGSTTRTTEDAVEQTKAATESAAPPKKVEKAEPPKPTEDAGATTKEIVEAMRVILRNEFPAALKPIVDQVNDLTKQAREHQEKFGRVESDNARLRAELDTLGDLVRDLTKAIAETKAARDATSEERAAEVKELKERVASLAEQLKQREEKKATVSMKPPPLPPPPPPAPRAWNTKTVVLPCGRTLSNVTLPPDGAYIRCPSCGALSFAK